MTEFLPQSRFSPLASHQGQPYRQRLSFTLKFPDSVYPHARFFHPLSGSGCVRQNSSFVLLYPAPKDNVEEGHSFDICRVSCANRKGSSIIAKMPRADSSYQPDPVPSQEDFLAMLPVSLSL